jgi:hypothetical protein
MRTTWTSGEQLVRAALHRDGRPPIGHMTPHTLRRTFASTVAVCDVSPRRAMYLMGHTDPTLTLGVYQQVMDVADGALDLLEVLLGCDLEEAKTTLEGGSRRRPPGTSGHEAGSSAGKPALKRTKGRKPGLSLARGG